MDFFTAPSFVFYISKNLLFTTFQLLFLYIVTIFITKNYMFLFTLC